MAAPISPAEEKVLRNLWTKGPQTASRAGADPITVLRLLDQSLIAELPAASPKAKPRIGLTDRGRQVASELLPARPKTIDLFRAIVALREEVRALRAMLVRDRASEAPAVWDGAGGASPPEPAAARPVDLSREIRDAVEELGRRERLGGLVPLPALRKYLAHLGVARDELDAALLAAERAYDIDLKVANDRSAVQDGSEGIMVEGRGLLYFVVAR